MRKHDQISGGARCFSFWLALVLIGAAAVWGQEGELVLRPIRNVIATSNAVTAGDDCGPENTVDGSGLNASGEHSTWAGDMWIARPQDDLTYIQFEFSDVYELEEMWVWNDNEWFPGGVREATITYSENGTDWTVFGDVECAEATGEDDYTANTIVSLEGIQARYVRLTVLSRWGSSQATKLSEVRFWTFTETTYQIHNVVATSNLTSDEGFEPENTVNDSGMSADDGHSRDWTDMWIVDPNDGPVSIQFAFDGLYELEEMWVWNCNTAGLQAKDVTIEHSENGVDWTVWGEVQFARATLDANCPATTFVSLNGIAAQYVRLTIHNTWHDNVIWVGRSGVIEDFQRRGLSEVRFFTKQPLSATLSSYVLILDTFETYTDNDNLGEAVFQTWIDTVLAGDTSQIGHTYTPFAETEIVHGDQQALPFYYDNTRSPYYAEVYRDLEVELQDWLIDGAEALRLYFHGSEDQDHEIESDRLYAVVEDDRGGTAVVYHPDPEALLSDDWQEWTIDFAQLAGVDLSHVTRLTLGIGNLNNPRPGAKSIIYIDDIGLTATVPALAAED